MTIDRRRFLATTGFSIAGGLLPAVHPASIPTLASESTTDLQDWTAVRDQFDLSRDYIHLSSFFLASHPRPVREAIEKHRRAIDDNPFLYVEERMFEAPAAFDFHKRIGRSRVAERIHSLNDQCKEGLARMRHVKLYTPRGDKLSAGIICFDVEGMKPEEVVKRLLDRRVVASTSPYAASCARLTPSLLNSPEEIETALREVRALTSKSKSDVDKKGRR